ncbi:MAG TPA: hypothetical protein VH853_08625 [Polyangia bacterium]|nr:hypothetical protein [Polyangia bacterium]
MATGMCGRKWTVDPVGEVEMADVAAIHLEKIDRRWPELRPETDLTINWRWTQIAASEVEAFTLLNRDEEPVAIWCSQRKRRSYCRPEATIGWTSWRSIRRVGNRNLGA